LSGALSTIHVLLLLLLLLSIVGSRNIVDQKVHTIMPPATIFSQRIACSEAPFGITQYIFAGRGAAATAAASTGGARRSNVHLKRRSKRGWAVECRGSRRPSAAAAAARPPTERRLYSRRCPAGKRPLTKHWFRLGAVSTRTIFSLHLRRVRFQPCHIQSFEGFSLTLLVIITAVLLYPHLLFEDKSEGRSKSSFAVGLPSSTHQKLLGERYRSTYVYTGTTERFLKF
jgi:hypothetical protein